MTNPLTSRPPYGEGQARTPTAEAKLPEGSPGGRGAPLSDDIPGTSTFVKPLDDDGQEPARDESIWRVRNPRDMTKERSQVDVNDQSNSGPGYMGLGKPHLSPKTKYPYRDGKPNTTNAALVAGLWAVERAPVRLILAERRTVVAAPLATLRNNLNPKTVQRAQSCTATLKRADLKNLRWIFSVDCGHGPYVVKFLASRKGNVTKFQKMDFHVACTCPAWRWQGPEFHSTTEGFQDPKVPLQGTASPPDVRDPDRINTVCKHVAAVLNLTRDWTIPKAKPKAKAKSKPKAKKPKAKKARTTANYDRIEGLFDALREPLGEASSMAGWRAYRGKNVPENKKDRIAQDLARESEKLLGALFFEFEDPEYGKRVQKKLRKIANFKKMLMAWSKARTWDALEPILAKQTTKSKDVWEKVWDYRKFVLGVIAALDVEVEETFNFLNYTVTMFTSPRADWDANKVEALKEILQRTNRTMTSRGLGKVTGGRVLAYPGETLPTSARGSGSAMASYKLKDDTIRLAANDDVAKVHLTLVHELGHRAYFRVIGSRGRAAWEQFFGDNVQPFNVDTFLSNWQRHWEQPDGWEAEKYGKYLAYYLNSVADEDEKMWLHLIADKVGIDEDYDRITGSPKKGKPPGFDQLMAKKDEVKVFLYPVTAYSGTDAHELFAEVFSLYAVEGPGRVAEIVRHAFRQALPQFKGANQIRQG